MTAVVGEEGKMRSFVCVCVVVVVRSFVVVVRSFVVFVVVRSVVVVVGVRSVVVC